MAAPPTNSATSDNDRVRASIENWKRKLLDLTKRNRALNFKVSKVSTVTVVDELAAEVFRQLYLQEKPMRFQATPDEDETQQSTTASSETELTSPGDDLAQLEILEDEDDALHNDFVPYEAASLDERHVDDLLQTTSKAEALDKSLRRLDELARSSIEEQGVNPLFLALGMLHYTESLNSTVLFKAPLVLLPVELTRKSARAGYQIRATNEDPMVNPALAEYIKQYSIRLPELPGLLF